MRFVQGGTLYHGGIFVPDVVHDNPSIEVARHSAIDQIMRVITDLPKDEQIKVLQYALVAVL